MKIREISKLKCSIIIRSILGRFILIQPSNTVFDKNKPRRKKLSSDSKNMCYPQTILGSFSTIAIVVFDNSQRP